MTRTPREPQIVSVWFPDLTLERWQRVLSQYRTVPGDDVPVILSRDGPHGPVIHSMNQTAQGRGISTGGRVVDAQAIHPDLHVEPADLNGDQVLMQRLVHWARRWCPWTAQDGTDGLVLDVTGCAHLFGGEAALLRDITRRFAMQGLTAQVAMAPTRGAAQAMARYAPAYSIAAQGDVAADLASLPVAALRLEGDMIRLLTRLGLKTIGALADVPRSALMRRFANMAADRNPLVLLDRALGRASGPLNAPPDHRHFMARARLAEPVIDPLPHLAGLVEDLCAALAAAEQGARQLQLTIYRIDSEYRTVRLATAQASGDPAHLLRLFDGKLDGIDPGFGFDLMTLEALRVEPVPLIQDRLDGTQDTQADVAGLLDRLTARLGKDKVTWSTWHETHKPERVEGRVPALSGAPCDPPDLSRERPLHLLRPAEEVQVIYAVPEGPPSQFHWRRVAYKTVRYAGPERIAPEWWQDRAGTRLRDYYKVEVQDGRRFWLYREGVMEDGRGGTPRWFMHGFFA
ncbi:Y-family DNA polymerase [Roseobacter weihaiensis]|uniref:Y-family DNA polymerase n=1 Tax=Roseobacter weihaiensis TaxID=2763262 RepID=UPI001D0B053A|nr:DNA polymerase Y family protein [Roseobacter sp. H9]